MAAHPGPTTEKEHIMDTAYNSESTHGFGSLKKFATRAVLTGGLGLAVIGLGAGTANADTFPSPGIMTCPKAVDVGVPFTVKFEGFPVGTVTVTEIEDNGGGFGLNGPVVLTRKVDEQMAAPGASWSEKITLSDRGRTLYAIDRDDSGATLKDGQCDLTFPVPPAPPPH
jgi:hypothetical protein